MVTQDKITKVIKDNSKNGLTGVIAIYFLMQMNTKLDDLSKYVEANSKKNSNLQVLIEGIRKDFEEFKLKVDKDKDKGEAYFFQLDGRIKDIEKRR